MRKHVLRVIGAFLLGMALGLTFAALDRPECSGSVQPAHCTD